MCLRAEIMTQHLGRATKAEDVHLLPAGLLQPSRSRQGRESAGREAWGRVWAPGGSHLLLYSRVSPARRWEA